MKIPLSLLKNYLDLDLPIEKIADTLTLLGIEVDSIINEHPPFAKVIVGEVLSVKPHGDKLQIAQVHNGKEAMQVVCGASNCKAGMKTAYAVPGAILHDRTIEKASIRGVDSYGMLCSAEELSLWKDDSGIMDLPLEWANGTDLASLLWDPIFELSLTPNLGHCLSALGLARELSAKLQIPLKKSVVKLPAAKPGKIQVHVDDFLFAPRYMGRLIENIQIGPSPLWLQKILFSCGLRPINNVVDVTNYILIKRGQPMHAFDTDRLDGHTLRIGLSKHLEKWTGLDGITREIPPDVLVISDAKKTVAIAGAVGGENSAVNETTRNIFLEAAVFDPMTVRKSAKKTAVRTDGVIRHEKGVDPSGVEEALNEAAQLILEISPHAILHAHVDLKKGPFHLKKIQVRTEKVNRLLGTKFSRSEMENIFKRLECNVSGEPSGPIIVEVPTYRYDLNEEVDLIEEVIRIYGYNHIDQGTARSTPSTLPNDPIYLFEKNLRNRLAGFGLQEFLTSDLISPKLADLCLEFLSARGIQLHKTLHAKTEEYSILRPSLLPGLLQVAAGNLDLKNNTFSAFEIGHIHFLQNGKSIEVPMLSLLLTGKSAPNHWKHKAEDVDFYTLKGVLENLMNALRISGITFSQGHHISFHPGRQADIRLGQLTIGSFGEIHPNLLNKMGIKQRLYFAELDIEHLLKNHVPQSLFAPIPNLPATERDWTITLAQETQIETLFQKIEKHRPKILEKFELIDLYTPMDQKTKNATLRFTYRDLLKTISADIVDVEHSKLISSCNNPDS